jgi:hypothetical protein
MPQTNVNAKINISGLDEAIEKANQLKALLVEVKELISSLQELMED